ncbi:MAG: hypothetical protein J3Q66DRAFT_395887 [Benniella sp.]|nr:MAG: hypothetical protein J3Q66DRAFT_395887 [Benniella sp.]
MLSDEISLRDHFRDHGFQVTTRKHSLDIRTLLDVWMGDTNRNIQQDDGLDIRTLLGTWRGDAIWFIQQESQLGHQDCTGDMDGRYKLDNTTGQLGHQDFNGDMDGGYNMDHTTGNTAWIRTLLETWMGDTNRIIQQETQPGSGLYWRHGWVMQTGSYNRAARISGFYWRHGWAIQHRSYKSKHSLGIRTVLETWMGDTNRIIRQNDSLYQDSNEDMDVRYKQDRTTRRQLGHQDLLKTWMGDSNRIIQQDDSLYQDSNGDMDGRYKQDHPTRATA